MKIKTNKQKTNKAPLTHLHSHKKSKQSKMKQKPTKIPELYVHWAWDCLGVWLIYPTVLCWRKPISPFADSLLARRRTLVHLPSSDGTRNGLNLYRSCARCHSHTCASPVVCGRHHFLSHPLALGLIILPLVPHWGLIPEGRDLMETSQREPVVHSLSFCTLSGVALCLHSHLLPKASLMWAEGGTHPPSSLLSYPPCLFIETVAVWSRKLLFSSHISHQVMFLKVTNTFASFPFPGCASVISLWFHRIPSITFLLSCAFSLPIPKHRGFWPTAQIDSQRDQTGRLKRAEYCQERDVRLSQHRWSTTSRGLNQLWASGRELTHLILSRRIREKETLTSS